MPCMWLFGSILLLCSSVAPAVAPLSPRVMEQVQSARDHSATIDGAGLYPLLEDALTWRDGDETGAAVPDYRAIAASPADYRGQRFLIEGRLLRTAAVRKLAKPGPWDDALNQWVIQHGPDEADVLVVYLLSPPADTRPGAQVRLPARFYMIWRAMVQNSEEQADYPVFVGDGARVLRPAVDNAAPVLMGLLLLMLLAMGIGFMVLRSRVKEKAIGPRRLAYDAPVATPLLENRHNITHPPQDDALLPPDPADALDELRRRHEE